MTTHFTYAVFLRHPNPWPVSPDDFAIIVIPALKSVNADHLPPEGDAPTIASTHQDLGSRRGRSTSLVVAADPLLAIGCGSYPHSRQRLA